MAFSIEHCALHQTILCSKHITGKILPYTLIATVACKIVIQNLPGYPNLYLWKYQFKLIMSV